MEHQPDYILEVKNVCKSFPGVKALDKVDFNLRRGEVHAIVGENGAGKSTLIKVFSGVYHHDAGDFYFEGVRHAKLTPAVSNDLGIYTIYQENTLIPELTVAENLYLDSQHTGKRLIHWKKVNESAKKSLEILKLRINPLAFAKDLGIAEQQGVQITKVVCKNAKVIIMDEPTASFGPEEIKQLFDIIRMLKEQGTAIIYISHHLEEVMELADRVTIMRDGKTIATHDIAGLTSEQMVSEMVGRECGIVFAKESVDIGKESLKVNDISKKGVLEGICFSLHEGEITGLYGLVGAGRTELAMTLLCAMKADTYDVDIYGRKLLAKKPKDVIKAGIGLITEDRRKTGLIMEADVRDNTVIAGLNNLRGRFLSTKEQNSVTQQYVRQLDIKTPSITNPVKFMSGGNQQKVAFAKWMFADKEILIFDEPTRGIDIGAKEEIYKIIVSLAKQGKSILLITSEMPELIALSDKVIVMKNGRLVAELAGPEITEEQILIHALGGGAVAQ